MSSWPALVTLMVLAVSAACFVPSARAATGVPGDPGGSLLSLSHRPLCGAVAAGLARCLSEVVTEASGAPLATSAPSGYGPSDLRSAYALGVRAAGQGSGHAIAIVAAYDNPTAEADLAVYRSHYGLPPCTTANGCFVKRDQHGGVSYPAADSGWGGEIALDLEMASAICPNCRLVLVEAASNAMSDLGAASDEAAALGATEISNSYGSAEYAGETSDEVHYNHPRAAITAAAGDQGYGVSFPAASRYVTAVGGTSLAPTSTGRGWTESVWSGTGSGCSAFIPKPSWQSDPGCAHRTLNDVAAVADPATGVAVFHTDGSNPAASGWLVYGGTSAAAPIIAGVYALTGHTTPANPFANVARFFDITAGSNGSCGSYLCQAAPAYDGPTGMGTPNGGPSQGPPPGSAPPPGGGTSTSWTDPGPHSPEPSPPTVPAAAALTRPRAVSATRRTLTRAFGRAFTHGLGHRIACSRGHTVTVHCRVSWRYRESDYGGVVTVEATSGGRGDNWRASYVVSKVSHSCRRARPKRHCHSTVYRSR